jgi:hypothetical protein
MLQSAPARTTTSLQQSANILGNNCLHWHWEWGTMVAAVGYLGYNASMDIVGWLWVVIHVGIRRVLYQAINNTLPTRRR